MNSWTGDVEDEKEEDPVDNEEEQAPEPPESDEEEAPSEDEKPPVRNLADEMTDDTDSSEETQEEEPEPVSSDSPSPPKPSGGMDVSEAADKDRRWKFLVWGDAGLFKSHFAYTMPEPVAYIDTENKAADIANKFSDREIHIWTPHDFEEAQVALNEALKWLNEWREYDGSNGTIVVDSMGVMWDWAQHEYILESYPTKDPTMVELSSNIGVSGKDSDWKWIKRKHNDEFREIIVESPFHFLWTARSVDDISRSMEEKGQNFKKPSGEKDNWYYADTVIRGRVDEKGRKVGDMTKSNLTDNKFMGLEKPTFPKVRDVIENIEKAESSDGDVNRSALEKTLGVEIVKGNPQQIINDDKEN